MIGTQMSGKRSMQNALTLVLTFLLCSAAWFKAGAQDLSGLASLLRGASLLA